MAIRPLEWQGNPKVPRADLVVPEIKADEAAGASTEGGAEKLTKNQLKKLLKEQQIAAKKAEKAKQKEDGTAAKGAEEDK
jgi:tryptophanyl-tRNA synthetase